MMRLGIYDWFFLAYFCVFIFFNMNQYLIQRDKCEEIVCVMKINIFVSAVLAVIFSHATIGFSVKRCMAAYCFV